MTLARELEDLEARRKAGTLSEADAFLAKEALLNSARGSAGPPPGVDAQARQANRNLLFAGLFSNMMMTFIVLATLGAMVYVFVPLTLAMPILIVLALCLPFIWLWEWFTGLF